MYGVAKYCKWSLRQYVEVGHRWGNHNKRVTIAASATTTTRKRDGIVVQEKKRKASETIVQTDLG
jgi:hypothetical protein